MVRSTARLSRPSHLALIPVLAIIYAAVVPEVQARELQRMYRSAYQTGRGDTGIAIADKQDAVLINPAGIAYGKGIYKQLVLISPMAEISSDTRSLVKEISGSKEPDPDTIRSHLGKNQHIGAYNFTGLILRRAAIGVVSAATTDVLVAKSKEDAGLEVAEAYASVIQGATFSLAHGLYDNALLIGATFKYLVRGEGEMKISLAEAEKVKDTKSDEFFGYGNGAGADLGVMYRGGGRMSPSFGLTVSDVGGTKFTPQDSTKDVSPLIQKVNVGVAIEPGTKASKFRILADFKDVAGRETENVYKRTHFGGELTFLDIVGVTGGLNQGYPCGGIYLDVRVLRIDLGAYTEEVGDKAGSRPDKRYFAALKAGF